jgi:hypothetical protein
MQPKPSAAPATLRDDESLVRLYVHGAGYFLGLVVEIAARSLVVDFPPSMAPALECGDHVSLALSTDRLGASLRLGARVAFAGKDAQRRRLRFEIDDDAQTALKVLIDRRGVSRVATGRSPVPATLSDEGSRRSAEASVLDVSGTGLSVFVATHDEDPLRGAERVSVALAIPGDPTPVRLGGRLFNRSQFPSGMRYGVQLDVSRLGAPSADQERYAGWVQRLQGELLRRLEVSAGGADSRFDA